MMAAAAATAANETTEPSRKLRILMLHGYTQSGYMFEMKTKALKKNLEKQFPPAPKQGHLRQYPGGLELVYPTGPLKLDPKDIPGYDVDGDHESVEAYGWWKRQGEDKPYEGMEKGFERIAEILRNEGPFDGVLGFSQGGAAAGIVASLLEPGRQEAFGKAQVDGGVGYPQAFLKSSGSNLVHPPLKFAVSYSGYGASNRHLYGAFYEPKIVTPILHFLGTMDTVVSEELSLRLVEACVNGRGTEGKVSRVVYHPGGHFLPSSQKQYVAALVAFIREVLGEELQGSGSNVGIKKEENVEDMDLPF